MPLNSPVTERYLESSKSTEGRIDRRLRIGTQPRRRVRRRNERRERKTGCAGTQAWGAIGGGAAGYGQWTSRGISRGRTLHDVQHVQTAVGRRDACARG